MTVRLFQVAPDWSLRGACRASGVDPMWFFPDTGDSNGSTKLAKHICAGCDVRQECLDYAVERPEVFGVWGGKTPKERRPLRMAWLRSLPEGEGPRHGLLPRALSCGCAPCRSAVRKSERESA